MPGIAGIISRRQPSECRRLVTDMLATMVHEQSYESGTSFIPEIGIYAAWTAHEHSDAACWSHHANGSLSLIFAGECVRDDQVLQRPGDPDVTRDPNRTSAIAALYRDAGVGFVNRLNGLFAGLLIDLQEERAFLFNDRYGLERIYYYETRDATYFASEAKALLRILPELRAFDDEGVAQYLALGCTLGTRTLFRGVRLLEGGSLWTFGPAGVRKERYFTPELWENQSPLSAAQFESEFEETFKRILPHYFEASSRIGISLTGGLDTRMIMACLPPTVNPPVCYTFSGRKHSTVDQRVAARVAAACGLEHHVLDIREDFLVNYPDWLDRTVRVTDGYSGAVGAHEMYFNARARQVSPVRLTGNFGSEVLRSVSTFKPINLAPELVDHDFIGAVQCCARQAHVTSHPVTFAAFQEIPWRLFGNLAAGRCSVTFRTPYLHNEIVALAFRAPDASRQSPDSALRLIRDNSSSLSRIPTDMGLKPDDRGPTAATRRLFNLVASKLDYVYQEGVPQRLSWGAGLIDRLASKGPRHRYLPYRHWFRNELANHVANVLTDSSTSQLPYWNRTALESIAHEHISGRKNYVREINAVMSLEAAHRLIVRVQ
jgi:asparagine synthase (glutamine-hydrolysing)